jgi:hypothetical protein
LEKAFLEFLECSPDVVWYRCEPITLWLRTATGQRGYRPDYLVELSGSVRLIVELRSAARKADPREAWKFELAENHCRLMGFAWALLTGTEVAQLKSGRFRLASWCRTIGPMGSRWEGMRNETAR